jgi:hypothetical protein
MEQARQAPLFETGLFGSFGFAEAISERRRVACLDLAWQVTH